MAAQQQQMSLAQQNDMAKRAIRARGVNMRQVIATGTVTPANNPVITVSTRNVGLMTGFWVKIVATVSNGSAVQINLSDFGPANILGQIQFNDLNNVTRIQTPGWHIAKLNTWRRQIAGPFGSALIGENGGNTGLQTTGGSYQGVDSPSNYGSNWTTISAPKTIAAGGTGTVTMWYYVPLAYNNLNFDKFDLRGAVYANVVNGTAQLNLTFAGGGGQGIVCAANGADSTQAVYYGNAAGSVSAVTLSSATYTVYQDYIDQLPTDQNNGVLVPLMDLSYIYELKSTLNSPFTSGQDNPYQYANYRDFLSTIAVYVNNGTTGARGTGADINYWALSSANMTYIWKVEPALQALITREKMGVDFEPGVYFFDSRNKPISTTQYGNMQLIVNPITAGTGAYQLTAVESFALVQQLSMAGSLSAS
jgi:hypothetical protein